MKNYLEYKNYFGSVEYSADDDCLYGNVLFIKSLISYEGNSVDEITKAFHDVVDEYLEGCKERGIEPNKPCSGTFNVRLGHDLHLRTALVAHASGETMNQIIRKALVCYLPSKEN